MGDRSFRFAPPELEIPASAEWTLRRAFGPPVEVPTQLSAEGFDADQASLWARSLGLAPRLAYRLGDAGLESALGAAAEPLALERRKALVGAVRIQELSELLGTACREEATSAILLKGAALLASGRSAPGSRRLLDLDVLVSQAAARPLTRRFVERGFSTHEEREGGDPVHTLHHPEIGVLELHVAVRGLFVGGRPATAERLRTAKLCRETEGAAVLAPEAAVLALHAVVHAVVQHGLSPTVYPLLRMVGDLIDLGLPDADAVASSTLEAPALSRRELEAALALARELEAGRLPQPGSDARLLLDHAIAGIADPAYHRSLGIAAGLRALARGRWRKLARASAARGRPTPGRSTAELEVGVRRRASLLAVLRASMGSRML